MSRSIHRRSLTTRLLCAYVVLVVMVSFAGVGYAVPGASPAPEASAESTASPSPTDETPSVVEEPTEPSANDPAVEPLTSVGDDAEDGLAIEPAAAQVPGQPSARVSPQQVELQVADGPDTSPDVPTGLGVVPVYVSGNPPCDNEFKIDASDWEDGTFTRDSEGVSLPDGASITISNSTTSEFDFSTAGVVIHKVIVKAGNGAYVYEYDPATMGDTGLYTVQKLLGGFYAISHVSFCYEEAPSTGSVVVRKYNDVNGNGSRDTDEEWLTGWTFLLERGDAQNATSWEYVGRKVTQGENGSAEFDGLAAGWYRITEELSAEQVAAGWQCTGPNPRVFYHSGEEDWSPADEQATWFGNRVAEHDKTFELVYEGSAPLDTTFWAEFTVNGEARQLQLSGSSSPYSETITLPHGSVIDDVEWYALWEPEGVSEKILLGTSDGETLTGDETNRFVYGAKIDGKKFEDLDADGIKDSGESTLPGWTIEAYRQVGDAWVLYETRVTDSDGYYKFYSPLPGTYRIMEDLDSQTGFEWQQSYPAAPDYHTCVIEPRMLASDSEVSVACVGTKCLDNHFLNWAPASISGMKFEDLNANGEMDEGESGLEGWIIYVDYDGDGVRDQDEPYDVTDADGYYEISGITPGTYPVREVLTAGWFQSFGLQHVVEFESRGAYEDYDFGNWTTATKSGTKFHDLDADGMWDEGEPGLPGWTIFVDYDDDGIHDIDEPSAVTGADGSYTIASVLPGTFKVREVMQQGWTQSYPADPDYYLVEFTSGLDEVGNDFGNWTTASIEGHKFNDLDVDGVFGGEDYVMAGWTIFVDYDGDGELDEGEPFDETDADGVYEIENIVPGTYMVREIDQDGWTQSRGDFEVTFESGQHYGENGAYDFGNWTTTGLSGYKFEDKDADGVWEQGDPIVPGVTIWLTGTDAFGQSVVATTTTGAGGYYEFLDLVPGDYVVSEVVTDGWYQSYPADGIWEVTLYSGGETVENLSFGNWRPADPRGRKIHDVDADGVIDEGEPGLEGWTIMLEGTTGWGESIVMTTTTDADGYWEFPVVPPGSYTISEMMQGGWTQSFPAGDGQYDLDLESGEMVDGLDFANWTTAEKYGTKFYDADGDGLPREDGEIGLPGWTIFVDYDYDGMLDEGEPFAVSGESGAYMITDIIPGTYPVREVMDDPDWRYTYPAAGWYLETFESDGVYEGNDFGNTTRVEKTFELRFETGVSVEATYVVSFTSEHVEQSPPLIAPPGDATAQAIAIIVEDHEIVLEQTTPGVYSAVLPVWPQTTLTDVEWWAQYQGEKILLGSGADEELITEPTLNSFDYDASVFGSKWDDTDRVDNLPGDGIWDDQIEPGMSGWTIELYRLSQQEEWMLYDTTVTGEGGAYTFADVLPGIYYLAEVIPTDPVTDLPTWTQSAGPDEVGEGAFPIGDGTSVGPVDFGNWEPGLPFSLDMGLVKDVDTSVARPGDTLTYTITWTMVEGSVADGEPFTITDDYDERYVEVIDASGGTVSDGMIVWNLVGPVFTGDTGSITYTMKVNDVVPDGVTNLDNTAVIEVDGDGDPSNNMDSERVTLEPFLPFTEPFLPFTGGELTLLLSVMLMAAAAGVALRVHGRRAA